MGKERDSKSFMATAVPMKGGRGMFPKDKCLEFMRENGDKEGRIIVKSDTEPAIKILVGDVVDSRTEGGTIVEEVPVGSKGSNGIVERAVKEIEGGFRALFCGCIHVSPKCESRNSSSSGSGGISGCK